VLCPYRGHPDNTDHLACEAFVDTGHRSVNYATITDESSVQVVPSLSCYRRHNSLKRRPLITFYLISSLTLSATQSIRPDQVVTPRKVRHCGETLGDSVVI